MAELTFVNVLHSAWANDSVDMSRIIIIAAIQILLVFLINPPGRKFELNARGYLIAHIYYITRQQAIDILAIKNPRLVGAGKGEEDQALVCLRLRLIKSAAEASMISTAPR